MSERYDIGIEGKLDQRTHTIIEVGAIKMEDEEIPVTLGFGGKLIGKASKLQRDDDNHVSVEVQLFEPYDGLLSKNFSFSLQPVEGKGVLHADEVTEKEPRVVTYGRLREITDVGYLPHHLMPQHIRESYKDEDSRRTTGSPDSGDQDRDSTP